MPPRLLALRRCGCLVRPHIRVRASSDRWPSRADTAEQSAAPLRKEMVRHTRALNAIFCLKEKCNTLQMSPDTLAQLVYPTEGLKLDARLPDYSPSNLKVCPKHLQARSDA